MRPKVFVSLTTWAGYKNDTQATFIKELKVPPYFLPPKMNLLVCGKGYHFDVSSGSPYLEEEPSKPIVIKLKSRGYPTAFFEMLKSDPAWVEE